MGAIAHGMGSAAATVFEGRLEQVRARRGVIDADEGRRERELRTLHTLSAAINQGFRDRGADELTSRPGSP